MHLAQEPRLPLNLFIPPTSSPTGLRFRLAEREDLRPLHAACYQQQPFAQFHALFQRLSQWQTDGRSYWLVVEDITIQQTIHVVGSGQLVIYPHGAELANLAVTADRRNQGIGTAMIHVLIAIARHVGLTGVEISVAVNNRRALALYRQLGFKEDRRLQLPGDVPAIILHKAL